MSCAAYKNSDIKNASFKGHSAVLNSQTCLFMIFQVSSFMLRSTFSVAGKIATLH